MMDNILFNKRRVLRKLVNQLQIPKGKEQLHVEKWNCGATLAEFAAIKYPTETISRRLKEQGLFLATIFDNTDAQQYLLNLMEEEVKLLSDQGKQNGISVCFGQVEMEKLPLPSAKYDPKTHKTIAPFTHGFFTHLVGKGKLFPSFTHISTQILRNVIGRPVDDLMYAVLGDDGQTIKQDSLGRELYETPAGREPAAIKSQMEGVWVPTHVHLDYDEQQMKAINMNYKMSTVGGPLFFDMAIEREFRLLLYGQKKQPQTRKIYLKGKSGRCDQFYVGAMQRIARGQMAIIAHNHWHATGPPKPLVCSEAYGALTGADTRAHGYVGMDDIDVDDTSLHLPKLEKGWTDVDQNYFESTALDYTEYLSYDLLLLNERKKWIKGDSPYLTEILDPDGIANYKEHSAFFERYRNGDMNGARLEAARSHQRPTKKKRVIT